MANRTGPTNPVLGELIVKLKRKSFDEQTPLWNRIAYDLQKPTRQRRAVNLSRIGRFVAEGEIAIVPGKVLGTGDLARGVTVSAWQFSEQAREKIASAGGKAVSIDELMDGSIKGKKVRIIG